MKVKTKEQSRTVVTIKLTDEQATMLAALAAFPDHSKQERTVGGFCEELWNALDDAGFGAPAGEWFVPGTSF